MDHHCGHRSLDRFYLGPGRFDLAWPADPPFTREGRLGRDAKGVLAVTPTQTHPSAAQYHFKTPAEMRGSVKEIRVANPHMRPVLHVTDNKGSRDLELEGHSLNNICRRGWRGAW